MDAGGVNVGQREITYVGRFFMGLRSRRSKFSLTMIVIGYDPETNCGRYAPRQVATGYVVVCNKGLQVLLYGLSKFVVESFLELILT